ncbi:MAG: MotE family protein [Alphaproteobacteria bacterium]
MLARIRILPVTIFVAALLLTLKVGNILQDWQALEAQVRPAAAQPAPEPGPAPNLAETPPPPAAPGTGAAPTLGGNAVRPVARAESQGLLVEDASDLSRSELQLLQDLSERRRQLDVRERQIQQREMLLQAAEQRLVSKQRELDGLRDELKTLVQKHDTQEQQQLKNLVSIYENMKPKDAALIFDKLEMPVLLSVAQNMNVRRVAPVIAAMEPDKARELTRELAERQKLPEVPR